MTATGGPARGDRLERAAARRAAAGLYLADDKRIAVGGDDVDLTGGTAPVAIQDDQPRRREMPRRHLLAMSPKRVLGPHRLHLLALTVPPEQGRG
jgi:hypothetical protein